MKNKISAGREFAATSPELVASNAPRLDLASQPTGEDILLVWLKEDAKNICTLS